MAESGRGNYESFKNKLTDFLKDGIFIISSIVLQINIKENIVMNKIPERLFELIGMTAGNLLCAAAASGDEDVVLFLLDHGVPVDSLGDFGETALFKSSEFDKIDVMRLLLDRGANPYLGNNNGATAWSISFHKEPPEACNLMSEVYSENCMRTL